MIQYGSTPAPAALASIGNHQNAYNQAALDTERLRELRINVDFAPLADVNQGGAIDPQPHVWHDARPGDDLRGRFSG